MFSVKNLTLARGATSLAENIALDVQAGQLAILVGPNGSGKTTFLRAIAGLFGPVDGEIIAPDFCWISAQPLTPRPETARDYLLFQAALMGTRPDWSRDPFCIAQHLETPVNRLSTGWRQRVKLTRLVMASKPLWLLDEPSDGLDDAGIKILTGVISAHRSAGGIAIIATHQPHLWPDAVRLAFGGGRA